jgi:hypothetical protein
MGFLNITMNNVQVSYLGTEIRPAIIMEDVSNVALFQMKIKKVTGTDNIFLKNVEAFSIQSSTGFKDKKIKQTSGTSF